jgi:hypothetical protein
MKGLGPRTINLLLPPLVNGVVLGAIVGGLMLYIAVQHNPQGEFYDLDRHTLMVESSACVFLSWFSLIALVVFLVESLILFVWRLVLRRRA